MVRVNAEWHVAWLAESMRKSLPPLFWRKFEGETSLPVLLLQGTLVELEVGLG